MAASRRMRGIDCAIALALIGLAGTAAVNASVAEAAVSVTVSPLNGTPDASTYTQISFLGVPASEISNVKVIGSRTGSHSGKLRSYVSEPGASFVVSHPFGQGESVTATATIGPKGHTQSVKTSFTIERYPDLKVEPGQPLTLHSASKEQAFVSQPKLHPPLVTVTANNPGTAPGDIFLTPTHGYGQTGPMILDPQGRVVWFHPVPKGDDATDFQVESYQGKPVLVFWEGDVPRRLGVGFGEDEILDTSYKKVATVNAGNGYHADLHEFQILPSGAAYLTAYSDVQANLSSVGGSSDGILQDALLQKVDIATGLVMFEWHAYGHVALGDSYARVPHFSNETYDFFHMNSISQDPSGDGNFIVSSRNMWAAYEINHVNGAILWRLGGKHPSFKMGPGTGTAYQHDVRWQPDGTLSIFDNGSVPKVHPETRILRERIDYANRSVSLIARFTAGHISAGSQGNAEALSNGDTFVGWGEEPYLTEFSPSGQVLFSAQIPSPGQSYRAFRFPWSATPASNPAIALKRTSAAAATVYASWNGATSVASWRVLAGASAASLAPVAQAATTGFETAVPVAAGTAYFEVQALGAEGQVLGTSGAIKG